MAITLKEINKWLDAKELNYEYMEEKERTVFPFGNKDINLICFFKARDEGTVFEAQVQIINDEYKTVDIKDHKYLSQLLQHMLYINYKTKFGTWEFDPSDGDIRLAIEIPLEDALMTEKQFNRILNYIMQNGAEYAQELITIMNTGEFVEDKDTDAELRAKLLAMLESLETGSDEKDDEDGI